MKKWLPLFSTTLQEVHLQAALISSQFSSPAFGNKRCCIVGAISQEQRYLEYYFTQNRENLSQSILYTCKKCTPRLS